MFERNENNAALVLNHVVNQDSGSLLSLWLNVSSLDTTQARLGL
jgi:hypothetical protein